MICMMLQGLPLMPWLQVSNMPSDATGNAASCAEHAIYLALALLRDQREMGAAVRARRVGVPLGQSLLGKTALLIGFGNIAKELVPRYGPAAQSRCQTICTICIYSWGVGFSSSGVCVPSSWIIVLTRSSDLLHSGSLGNCCRLLGAVIATITSIVHHCCSEAR